MVGEGIGQNHIGNGMYLFVSIGVEIIYMLICATRKEL